MNKYVTRPQEIKGARVLPCAQAWCLACHRRILPAACGRGCRWLAPRRAAPPPEESWALSGRAPPWRARLHSQEPPLSRTATGTPPSRSDRRRRRRGAIELARPGRPLDSGRRLHRRRQHLKGVYDHCGLWLGDKQVNNTLTARERGEISAAPIEGSRR